jgi:hypothetical protein
MKIVHYGIVLATTEPIQVIDITLGYKLCETTGRDLRP